MYEFFFEQTVHQMESNKNGGGKDTHLGIVAGIVKYKRNNK